MDPNGSQRPDPNAPAPAPAPAPVKATEEQRSAARAAERSAQRAERAFYSLVGSSATLRVAGTERAYDVAARDVALTAATAGDDAAAEAVELGKKGAKLAAQLLGVRPSK